MSMYALYALYALIVADLLIFFQHTRGQHYNKLSCVL